MHPHWRCCNWLQLEAKSEHPPRSSDRHREQAARVGAVECAAFQSSSGKGASGLVNGRRIAVGNARYFAARNISRPDGFARQIATCRTMERHP